MQAALDALTKGDKGSEAQANGDASMQGTSEALNYSCDVCGTDCTASRYHSIRREKSDPSGEVFDVCPNCYTEGRFPSNMFSGDFVRLTSSTAYRAASTEKSHWSDQETLLLFEGLEMFNDDWDRISEHVGSRTREDCVAHFLQLPIEDQYLVAEGGMAAANGVARSLGRVDKLPFTQPDHPVLSVVAFLASVVDPEIAAKAASDSVAELSRALKRKADALEGGDTGDTSNKGDGMAVDQSSSSTTQQNDVHRSASVALGSAAAKAHLLAQQTSAELTSQIHSLVSAQITKLSIKMQQFEALETGLDNERRQIEMARSLLQMERLGVEKQLDAVADLSRRVGSGEPVQLGEVDKLRAMGLMTNGTDGHYRSGMPPRVVPVSGNVPPLGGQTSQFARAE